MSQSLSPFGLCGKGPFPALPNKRNPYILGMLSCLLLGSAGGDVGARSS